jgi:hypothetical protein
MTHETPDHRKMSKANLKRLVACASEGHHVFLVYRHGNPKDVFQSSEMTTDPEIKECSDYDFRLEPLGVDSSLEAWMRDPDSVIASWNLARPENDKHRAASELFLERLNQAIADGSITFPPDAPGSMQSGN